MTQITAINVTYTEGQFRIFSMPSLPSAQPPLQIVNHLIEEAESIWDIPKGSIKSKRKFKQYCHPRFAVIYAARRMSTRSYPEIGRAMGGRDHSTIIHGEQRATYLKHFDADFSAMVDRLMETVRVARRGDVS